LIQAPLTKLGLPTRTTHALELLAAYRRLGTFQVR
jgi:hypothetical protein